jgi:hypothetical protein
MARRVDGEARTSPIEWGDLNLISDDEMPSERETGAPAPDAPMVGIRHSLVSNREGSGMSVPQPDVRELMYRNARCKLLGSDADDLVTEANAYCAISISRPR